MPQAALGKVSILIHRASPLSAWRCEQTLAKALTAPPAGMFLQPWDLHTQQLCLALSCSLLMNFGASQPSSRGLGFPLHLWIDKACIYFCQHPAGAIRVDYVNVCSPKLPPIKERQDGRHKNEKTPALGCLRWSDLIHRLVFFPIFLTLTYKWRVVSQRVLLLLAQY